MLSSTRVSRQAIRAVLLLASLAVGRGHGALYIPTPRNAMDRALPEFEGGKSPIEACTCNNGNGGADAGPKNGCDMGLRKGIDGKGDGQSCLWWSQGCSIGCEECATVTAGTAPISGNVPQSGKIGFRKRYCNSTQPATLPRQAWTLNTDAEEGSDEDSYRFNPWRAPGFAPVVDPCGQAGGEFGYQHLGGDSVFHNTSMAGMGMLGSTLPPSPVADRPTWQAGTSVEVAWGVRYNHGGGYAYRLCPAGEPLTEACFQAHHLDFDPTKQVLKWNNGSLQYAMGDKAIFVAGNATNPPHSMWARNPIPRIWDSKVGLHNPSACPGPSTRAQRSPPGCMAFPPPCPWDTYNTTGLLPCGGDRGGGLLGRCDGNGMSQCSSDWVVGVISDHIIIPIDLAPGNYVLGWRWDCEETAQIWQNCADVVITAAAA